MFTVEAIEKAAELLDMQNLTSDDAVYLSEVFSKISIRDVKMKEVRRGIYCSARVFFNGVQVSIFEDKGDGGAPNCYRTSDCKARLDYSSIVSSEKIKSIAGSRFTDFPATGDGVSESDVISMLVDLSELASDFK